MKRARVRVWPIAKVYAERPCALAVWLALDDLRTERGTSVVTPTRAVLSARSGANEKSVSAALTLLASAGWIDRVHIPVLTGDARTATLLRIVLRRKGRRVRKIAPQRGRSTPYQARGAVEGVQRPIREGSREGVQGPKTFLKERGAVPAAAPSSNCGAVAPADLLATCEHPSDRAEREQLAKIRAAREAAAAAAGGACERADLTPSGHV